VPEDNEQTILEAIERAARSFADSELAFLALTSKIERPFFDRLAFHLHCLAQPSCAVAREWPVPGSSGCRADLALLSNAGPVALLEGKAIYTFDPTRNRASNTGFVDRMQSDLDRLESARLSSADVYCLLLATHPCSPVPEERGVLIKYPKKINSAFRRIGNEAEIYELADRMVRENTDDGALRGSGRVPGGTALGISVDLAWWLFGPFQSPDNLQICRTGA